MTEATFDNVSFATVREVLPKGSFLPLWSKFTVNVKINDSGQASVELFNRYYFDVSSKSALKIIKALSSR